MSKSPCLGGSRAGPLTAPQLWVSSPAGVGGRGEARAWGPGGRPRKEPTEKSLPQTEFTSASENRCVQTLGFIWKNGHGPQKPRLAVLFNECTCILRSLRKACSCSLRSRRSGLPLRAAPTEAGAGQVLLRGSLGHGGHCDPDEGFLERSFSGVYLPNGNTHLQKGVFVCF